MQRPPSAPAQLFAVTAIFTSGGERFAQEQFLIEVPVPLAPHAVARRRAEQSTYANRQIPGLAILLIVTPCSPPHPPDRSPPSIAGPIVDHAIGSYLLLSTAHLSGATARLLDHWAVMPALEQPIAVTRTHHGWLIATQTEGDGRTTLIPIELPPVLALGKTLACAYILFDCDGPENPWLPVYPW